MSANDRQVGGEHYRTTDGEQHWDRQWRLYGRGYFVGCITKYVERYPDKNGLQDLKKAAHFLEKLIELEQGPGGMAYRPEPAPAPAPVKPFIRMGLTEYRCTRCGADIDASSEREAIEAHGSCAPAADQD